MPVRKAATTVSKKSSGSVNHFPRTSGLKYYVGAHISTAGGNFNLRGFLNKIMYIN